MDAPALKSAPSRRARLALLGLAIALVVGVSIQYGIKASQRTGHRSAFLRWRPQILEMSQGVNIQEKHIYPNPPIMGLILLPVFQMTDAVGAPPIVGALIWFYLKVGMTILIFLWVFRLVEDPQRPFPFWAKILAIGLSLRPIVGDLSHGNVNLFILFLVVGFLYALHRNRQLLAGLTLGLAISCKITPALFIPYLIWKRAPKAVGGCIAGLALFFYPGLVPASIFGWQQQQEMTDSWVKNMVKPFLVDGVVTSEHNNQSLPGLAYRLLTYNPSFSDYDQNHQLVPMEYHNLANWSTDSVRWLLKGVMLLFVLLIAWTCRPTLKNHEERMNHSRAAEYSLVLLGMLLFSERTWKHHCVLFALPFAVICYQLAISWRKKPVRGLILGSLVLIQLILATSSTSLMGKEFGKLAQVYGSYTICFLFMMALLTVILRANRSATGDQQQITESPPLRLAG